MPKCFFLFLAIFFILSSCSEERTVTPETKQFSSPHLSLVYPNGYMSSSNEDSLRLDLSETSSIEIDYLDGNRWLEAGDFRRALTIMQASAIAFGNSGMEKARLEDPITINNRALTGIYLQMNKSGTSLVQNSFALDFGGKGVVFNITSKRSDHSRLRKMLMEIIRSTEIR